MRKVKGAVPYILAGVLCLCAAVPLFSNSIVLDEAYSVTLVRGSVQEIVRGAASDVHPPLYYLLLKLSSLLFGGESLMLYRAVTVLATCLNLFVLGATVIRKRWGNRVSVLYLLWFGTVYATIEFSTFVRMYSWGTFWVTASALAALFFYEKESDRHLVLGVILTLAAMYTHYYTIFSVFIIWLSLFFIVLLYKRRLILHVLAGGLAVVLGYLPWLGVLLSQSRKVAANYWISGFEWKEWLAAPAHLMECSLEGMDAILCFLLILLLLIACLERNRLALLSGAVFIGTMLAGALLSVLVRPIWNDRYLYVAWGMLALFAALAAGQIQCRYVRISQAVLCVILCFSGYFGVQNILGDETMTSEADEWVEFLREEVDGDAELIIDDFGEHKLIFEYYCPDADIRMADNMDVQTLQEILDQAEGRQVWYIANYREIQFGAGNMEDMLKGFGYSLYSAGNYELKGKDLEIFRVEAEKHEGA